MIAMKTAKTDQRGILSTALQLIYNKARQGLRSTRNFEIVGGAASLLRLRQTITFHTT